MPRRHEMIDDGLSTVQELSRVHGVRSRIYSRVKGFGGLGGLDLMGLGFVGLGFGAFGFSVYGLRRSRMLANQVQNQVENNLDMTWQL